MTAGPILEFKGEHRFLSNFHDGHHIWLGLDDPYGVRWQPRWLCEDRNDELLARAAAAGLLTDDGAVRVRGVERPFQAFKTDDLEVAVAILAADTPGMAKRMGKPPERGGRVADLREGWDTGVSREAMRWLLARKFGDRPGEPAGYGDRLLGTGYRMLVEGNTWGDRTWGAIWMGLPAAKDAGLPVWARDADPKTAPLIKALAGENWLGRLLMLVRAGLDCQVRP
jgi:predicted NAD-dependent protein-ADP-ribosyltransferase YbiA (DUF1768 family)